MTTTTQNGVHAQGHEHHEAEKMDRDQFGFWLYIISDCVMFATLFASFFVYKDYSSQGTNIPTLESIVQLPFVAIETLLLLTSSFTFGLVMLAMHKKNAAKMKTWIFVTFVLGAAFIGMEVYEFHHLVSAENITPSTWSLWSIFFTLVGTHGLHVTIGLIWMVIMLIALSKQGLTFENKSRITMLSLFWHFLDIIWICVFSFVYLFGAYS